MKATYKLLDFWRFAVFVLAFVIFGFFDAQCGFSKIPEVIRQASMNAVVVRVPEGGGAFSVGSGTYLGDGLYFTAWHVVRDNPRATVTVTWKDGQRYASRVVAGDSTWDMALLESPEKLPGGVPLTERNLKLGDTVFLGGYARRKLEVWPGKVVSYSSPSGNHPNDWFNATGAAISGDSGGPVFTETGCFVGCLWGSGGGRTIANNYGRTQRFLLPWNARLAAWQSQGRCPPGGYCPPPGQRPYAPPQSGGGGRTVVEGSPTPPTSPPEVTPPAVIGGGNNNGWPSSPSVVQCPPQQPDINAIANQVADVLVGDEELREKLRGPAGLAGKDGRDGRDGENGQVSDDELAAVAMAVFTKMKGDPTFRGPAGPPGKPSDMVSESEVERIKRAVLANLPARRVLLVDGKNGTVLDDENYEPGEPIVLDFQRVIGAARAKSN